jgi:cell division protease FtsH
MSEHEKRVIAYHEAGHALVGHVLPDADDVHKVSIVARGRALGLTWYLPEDRYTHNKAQLQAHMAAALGGRTAEELVFGEITTGAANDIEKCTEIAQAMVTQYGMSDRLGPRKFGQEQGEVFLGREVGHQRDYSDDVAAQIDSEVNTLIDGAHDEARSILETHRDTLDALARALIERETVDDTELAVLFAGIEPWARQDAGDDTVLPPPTSITPKLAPVADPAPVPVGAAPATARPPADAPKLGLKGRLARWRRPVRPEASS